jgi:hypothetical protein
MDEGIQKDLAMNQEKYARLLADTINNENLNADEKEKLQALLREQEFESTKEIELKYAEELANALKESDAARQLLADEEAAKRAEFNAEFAAMAKEKQEKDAADALAAEKAYQDARYSLVENSIKGLTSLAQLYIDTLLNPVLPHWVTSVMYSFNPVEFPAHPSNVPVIRIV